MATLSARALMSRFPTAGSSAQYGTSPQRSIAASRSKRSRIDPVSTAASADPAALSGSTKTRRISARSAWTACGTSGAVTRPGASSQRPRDDQRTRSAPRVQTMR